MYKLLIAEGSEPFADELAAVLQSEFELQTCRDGERALELLLSFQPDVMILDLRLPFKDGLTVLQESAHRPRVILAITAYISGYVEKAAMDLGVQYIMNTPSVNALRVRLMDILANTVLPREDITGQVLVHLHMLNFPTHLDGYRQLSTGLPLFAKNPDMCLSKELYPVIAETFSLPDPRTVEHSIRKAIKAAWERGDPLVWAKYFPPNADGSVPCPSNKAFFSRLAEMLKL